MPDGPYKAMTPDPDTVKPICAPEKCEKCGGMVWAGDWPFCKGNAEDHKR